MSISHTISHTSQTIQMFESQSPPPRSQQQLQLLLPVLQPLPLRLLLLLLILLLLLLLLLLLPPGPSCPHQHKIWNKHRVARMSLQRHRMFITWDWTWQWFFLRRYHNVGRNVEFMYKYKSMKIDGWRVNHQFTVSYVTSIHDLYTI